MASAVEVDIFVYDGPFPTFANAPSAPVSVQENDFPSSAPLHRFEASTSRLGAGTMKYFIAGEYYCSSQCSSAWDE